MKDCSMFHFNVQELVVEENRMTIDSTGSLNINSLDIGDRGSFICEISNTIGHAKQQYQVDIYGIIFCVYRKSHIRKSSDV